MYVYASLDTCKVLHTNEKTICEVTVGHTFLKKKWSARWFSTMGLEESMVYAFDNSSTPFLMESCYSENTKLIHIGVLASYMPQV